jgi:hypothetical protein
MNKNLKAGIITFLIVAAFVGLTVLSSYSDILQITLLYFFMGVMGCISVTSTFMIVKGFIDNKNG